MEKMIEGLGEQPVTFKQPAVEFQSIRKNYGSLEAVRGLSLEIFHGEVLGFLGPNGAGKTTTIQILCGLLAADSGCVLIDGEQMAGAGVKERIGLCPQDALIWPHLTCGEQLEWMGALYGMGRKAARQRSEHLLGLVNLQEKRHALGRTLSGGMKRRLNLALALVHDPEILVLDEPEAGLDPQSRILVRDLIRSMAHTKTIILTTHNMDEADRLADRVVVMDEGRLLNVGTAEDLKRSIGGGDVLELLFISAETAMSAERALGRFEGVLHRNGCSVTLRSLNLLPRFAQMMLVLEEAGCNPEESRLRQNTLEDVFIHLTGRSLRA